MIDELELKRKGFHLGVGLFFVILITFQPTLEVVERIGSLFPLTGGYLPLLARALLFVLIPGGVLVFLCRRYRVPGVRFLLRHFEREEVRERFPGRGAFFYALGAFVIATVFTTKIVAASIMILSIGDSMSHLIGSRFGKMESPLNSSKMIEGIIGGAVLSGLGASLIIAWPTAFTVAFATMFVEGMDFKESLDRVLDDNLYLPILSGVLIYVLGTVG